MRPLDFAKKVLIESLKIPSISPSGDGYEEISQVYRELMVEIGLNVEVHKVPQQIVDEHVPKEGRGKPRFIVVGRLGEGRPIIHFNGHYDVVPGGSNWTVTEPFKPVEVEGKIYGRGATDMKGGIAAFLASILSISERVGEFKGTIEAALVPDEEIGGVTGTKYLLDHLVGKPDYAVIGEPSTIGRIYIGHKGAVWANVVVRGRTAHGSIPWLGENAFEKMVYVAEKFITDYKKMVESKKSMYEYDVPEGSKGTVNLGGKISSIGKVNVVPDIASFSIDRRLIVEEKVEDVIKELQAFIEDLRSRDPSLKLELEVMSTMEPVIVSGDSKLVQIFKEASREVLGFEAKPVVCIGGLDMRYYVEKGVETVTYGPGAFGLAHAPNEYIEVEDLDKAIKIYERSMLKLLKMQHNPYLTF